MNNEIQTWRYQFPSEKGEGWAVVFMDSTGCFAALSDWGSCSYRWSQAGWGPGDFRKFLLSCDDGYLASKFGQGRREYDPEGTVRSVKERLEELERGGDLSVEDLAEERELLRRFDDLDNEMNYMQWRQETKIDVSDGFSMQRYERDVTSFIKRVMPRLRQKLKDELAEPVASASPA